jgi:ribosome-associated translation inhibitor RaiA
MMPLALRTSGIELSPALRKQIQTRMDRRLGKIAPHVERVTVRFEDTNGPRGGVDTVCRIKVVLSGLPSVLAHQKASNPETAFKRADHRVEQAVKKAITRGQARGMVASGMVAPSEPPRPPKPKRKQSSTASRNFKKRTGRAVAQLEGSATGRPSRKSTRKSVNRSKQGNKLATRQTIRATSPKRRALKARSRAR